MGRTGIIHHVNDRQSHRSHQVRCALQHKKPSSKYAADRARGLFALLVEICGRSVQVIGSRDPDYAGERRQYSSCHETVADGSGTPQTVLPHSPHPGGGESAPDVPGVQPQRTRASASPMMRSRAAAAPSGYAAGNSSPSQFQAASFQRRYQGSQTPRPAVRRPWPQPWHSEIPDRDERKNPGRLVFLLDRLDDPGELNAAGDAQPAGESSKAGRAYFLLPRSAVSSRGGWREPAQRLRSASRMPSAV